MSTLKQNLIDVFELDKMPGEKMNEMLERLSKLVFQAVLVRALPLLSEEDLNKYEKMVGRPEGGDALLKFLSEKVPNFDKMIAEETEILHTEMIA